MRVLFCLLFSCLAAAALAGDETKLPMMRVGAAAVDITPKPGTPMAGYYRFRAVEGVRDPLYAKAIVIEQDGSLAALVALDLVSTSRPVVEQARELIRRQSSITPEQVLISATHTHTGPQLPRDSLMDEITRANAPEGLAYLKALPLWIAEAVAKAKAALAPAGASAAIGKVKGISFNRRVLRDGSNLAIWQPRTIDQANYDYYVKELQPHGYGARAEILNFPGGMPGGGHGRHGAQHGAFRARTSRTVPSGAPLAAAPEERARSRRRWSAATCGSSAACPAGVSAP